MSSPYQGNAANIAQFTTATMTNATNATPIAITTSAAHLYASGDTVVITGVTGNTAANGTFVIVVTSSTSFTLTGSVGNGAYVSGGTAKDLNLLPFAAQPSNGDVFTVDQLNTYLSNLADKIQYLALKVPTNRLIAVVRAALSTNQTTASAPLVDVPGLTLSFTVNAGDFVVINTNLLMTTNTAGTSAVAQLTIIDGGTTVNQGPTVYYSFTPTSGLLIMTPSAIYTAVNTGTLIAKMQFASQGGAIASMSGGASTQSSSMMGMQYRP